MATKADRYEGIDGLKAYAIIGIALMHVLSNGELGGNVLTMLFFCVAALVYTLGCNRGGDWSIRLPSSSVVSASRFICATW